MTDYCKGDQIHKYTSALQTDIHVIHKYARAMHKYTRVIHKYTRAIYKIQDIQIHTHKTNASTCIDVFSIQRGLSGLTRDCQE